MVIGQVLRRGKKLPPGADEFTAFLKIYIARWAGRAGVPSQVMSQPAVQGIESSPYDSSWMAGDSEAIKKGGSRNAKRLEIYTGLVSVSRVCPDLA